MLSASPGRGPGTRFAPPSEEPAEPAESRWLLLATVDHDPSLALWRRKPQYEECESQAERARAQARIPARSGRVRANPQLALWTPFDPAHRAGTPQQHQA